MKGLLKPRPDSPCESYPLSTFPLNRTSTPSQSRLQPENSSCEDEEPQPPGSPDSQTPLKNNLRSSNHFPLFTPSFRRRRGSMPKGNDHTGGRVGDPPRRRRHPLIWSRKQLSSLLYYLKYAWFLMKCASSRTMTLPIGFSTPPSLEKGIQTTPVLIGNTFKLLSPQNPLRKGIAQVFRSA